MLDIKNSLEQFSATDAREIAYYLGRYFKGMPWLEPDGKDFFADAFAYQPTREVRNKVEEVIKLFEQHYGQPIHNFTKPMSDDALAKITDFENALEGEITPDQLKEADAFFKRVSEARSLTPSEMSVQSRGDDDFLF